MQNELEKERKICHSLIHFQILQRLGRGGCEARSQEHLADLTHCRRGQELCCFPEPYPGSCTGDGALWIWTSTHMGCWYCNWRLNLLHSYCFGPSVSFFKFSKNCFYFLFLISFFLVISGLKKAALF